MHASPNQHHGPLEWLHRIEKAVYAAERMVFSGSLIVMLLAVGYTVIVRNLGLASPNYGELGLAAMVPLTLIGGAMCTYLGSHISVEIVNATSSRLLKSAGGLIVALATIAFAALYAYSGSILIEDFRSSGDKLLDLGTPLWLLAVFFPIGMLLMIFHSVVRIVSIIAKSDEVARDLTP